jgi:glutamyl-tRNA reductase
MTIVNVSVSCRTAPAGVLQKIAVLPGEGIGLLARMHAMSAIDEIFLLSTCSRVEVYATTRLPPEETVWAVAGALAARGGIQVSEFLRQAGINFGAAAAEHLFSVASGLESMRMGEERIVARVETAQQDAAAAGTTGPVLTGLVEAALRASKRVRSETTARRILRKILYWPTVRAKELSTGAASAV